MPPVRRYRKRKTPARRSVRTYARKTYRSRFSRKKRFIKYKNGSNMLNMNALLSSRNLNVKLPIAMSFTPNIASGTNTSFAFQGNAAIPYTASGQSGVNNPSAGDIIPAGLIQYAQFYNQIRIYGSSIKLEIINTAVSTSIQAGVFRCVLLAVPFTNQPVDNWVATKAQLDTYGYDALLNWPGAYWRSIASSSGSNNKLYFKMFRKTKSMCGVKDMRDQFSVFNQGSPESTAAAGLTPPSVGFMYYLRIFNQSTTTSIIADISVRMKLYVGFYSKEFIPPQVVT